MKFEANSRRRAIDYEKDLVRYWQDDKTFEKSVEQRPADNTYVFYDGPPFITGVPHHGTLLSSIVKDAVPRYWTMKGKRVERVWGWDTHGLPAENFVEKKLGITSRHEVGEKISLADYITAARENMVSNAALWEDTIARIGRWVDFKGAYKTMDREYMESVWWAFKTLYDKGKIYEGEKVLMYDTKWATPLSKAEVTMDAGAYVTVTDPSVYVKFKLTDDDAYLLAWTTTPWTLPANSATAVNNDVDYAKVRVFSENYIVAKDLIEKIFTDEKHAVLPYEIIDEFKGSDLVGKKYEPLFEDRGPQAHKVWAADYVTTDSGTGIVHLAPAYGEEDFELARTAGIPVVHVLDDYGKYTDGEWIGQDVWESNKPIAKELHDRGVVWKIDYYRHEYPHNPRTGQRLMYRAHPSWFFDIAGQREEMLAQNSENITWFPPHIKHGRFEKTIETAPDWNLSRDRFWATAMPVWKGDKGSVRVIGSYAELKELSGVELEDYHRPWIDEVTFTIDGEKFTRIDKVLDGWFESGSMPFAQFHYPFENKAKFESNFPGDFIAEYVGQVRAWFYYLQAVNVGLFGSNAFKNVIVTGNVAGDDGFKMSKSRGNFTDPNILMDEYSADSLRFLLLSSPLLNGEDFALHDREVGDVARKLSMIWNMYDFFTTYASVDGWDYEPAHSTLPADPLATLTNPLDIWIVSRVHQLTVEVTEKMDGYDIAGALKPVLPFIDDASNWYVRRSRRRFWKSEDDGDKNDAYRTLHYVLVRLSLVLAPFTPFLAEELYRKLTGGESVHLLDWPNAGNVNELVVEEMGYVREAINSGLSERARTKLKVRQPLAGATLVNVLDNSRPSDYFDDYAAIIKEELNVKTLTFTTASEETGAGPNPTAVLDTDVTPALKREGQAREIIRFVQNARKDAGLNVDDRIVLSLTANGDLKTAIDEFGETIASETLATQIGVDETYDYDVNVTVDGEPVAISLKKA